MHPKWVSHAKMVSVFGSVVSIVVDQINLLKMVKDHLNQLLLILRFNFALSLTAFPDIC